METSGDAYGVDPIDQEDDEAATSLLGGYESDDSNDDEGNDDGDENVDEDDDDDDEAANDDKVRQKVEEDKVGEEELGRSAVETPCQPLKMLRRGMREESPACSSDRELRGNPQKSLSLQNHMLVQMPSRRRHALATIL